MINQIYEIFKEIIIEFLYFLIICICHIYMKIVGTKRFFQKIFKRYFHQESGSISSENRCIVLSLNTKNYSAEEIIYFINKYFYFVKNLIIYDVSGLVSPKF